jgi:PAB-dependent poly(A)-specific ribonuclease subunit 2
MSTTYRSTAPITYHRDLYAQPVTALSFDPVSDTLWSGSSVGNVIAFYGARGTRGVSFPVGGNQPVKKIISGENYVRSHGIDGEGLGSWAKGGMNKWYFQ